MRTGPSADRGARSTTQTRSPRCTGRSIWASTSSTRPTSTATAAASGWSASCAASGGEEIHVATKAGRRLNPHTTEGYNRENLVAFVDRSLKNLATETIDLLQLHCPPNDVYYRPEVFEVLDDLVAAGKLRYYGVSVKSPEEGLKAMDYPNVQSVQIIFNMLRHRPAELFFAEAKRRKVGILARVPLASGLLSGKLHARHRVRSERPPPIQPPGRSVRRRRDVFRRRLRNGPRGGRGIESRLPAGHDADAIRTALDPDVRRRDVRDPRRKRPAQAEENCAAADLPPLSEQRMAAVRRIYDQYARPQVHHRW